MRDNPYKDLPPLERRPDGSLYRMTPAQRKQAYTTVYRTLDNAVQLSDDGSVYVEPEVPEPGEPQPTQEERIKALEDQNETLLQCILEMSEIVYA